MSNYPTIKEILKEKQYFNKEEISSIILWKTLWYKNWKKKSKKYQIKALKELIKEMSINEDYDPEYPEDFEFPIITESNQYSYNYWDNEIEIDKSHPSIISTLHEIGHSLHGNSEHKACRWSIQLFKRCFNHSFKKLKFKGHLLVKK